MNEIDIFYRAFAEYRKETDGNAECKRFREAARAASAEQDRLEAVRTVCVIEEDWVNTICEELPYVEKAIREERQFIRQEGNVVPIERAKRVSKDSVVHLARHSELITHVPEEGEDLIPDRLYVVEKLSDFTVYENRFLYMLLCYLRDFIELRYNKIEELGNTYHGNLTMKKEIRIDKRRLSFHTEFFEEAKNDPYADGAEQFSELMGKLEASRHWVAAMLLTPLMKEVSAAPLLKPPITRTNAMRMDNNFKHALALYDFLVSYQKDGYYLETIRKTYSPFSREMGEEFAELVALTSFLTYQYGKEIKPSLRRAYEEEELRRMEAEEERQRLYLQELKQRVAESGQGMEEYLLLLERRNQTLEQKREQLRESERQLRVLQEDLLEFKQRQSEILEETAAKEIELRVQRDSYEQKLIEQQAAADADRQALAAEYDQSLRAQRERLEEQLAEQRTATEEQVQESERLREEQLLLRAQLHAQKQINGSIAEEGDFTDRQRFEELEREYEALGALLKGQWKKTKKKIRERILWNKTEGDEAP
ncbi:MAG: DUF2357 domain-containing protein [Clostridia bacterium]|nr:DUF2357 domain-containing protein [Clostridia bacterium]